MSPPHRFCVRNLTCLPALQALRRSYLGEDRFRFISVAALDARLLEGSSILDRRARDVDRGTSPGLELIRFGGRLDYAACRTVSTSQRVSTKPDQLQHDE
jgi:hypothetical protein